MVKAVEKQPLVAVIGASGSGKSSVVLAGLFPELRQNGSWLIGSFRPQSQPLYTLAFALVRLLKPEQDQTQQPRCAANLLKDLNEGKLTLPQVVASVLELYPGKRLLLVIDQFEELYTLCRDTPERERFVDALLAVIESEAHKLTVVLTLRADFYSYALNYPPFGEALEKYPHLPLRAMNQEEMQAAIELPAEENWAKLEAGLTQRILDDVKQEPGNLPLLEFALTELWKKQSREQLTHQAYTEIGGVARALANHADKVYGKLSEAEQKQVKRIFVQLVRPGEGTKDTRRVATRGDVGNWDLATRLADARLVVTGRDEQTGEETVEVVHESLIREWKTLGRWMEDDRSFRIWQDRLEGLRRQWEQNSKDDGSLLRGMPLVEAASWQEKRLPELSKQQRIFIERSFKLRDHEKKERESQQQRTIIMRTTAFSFGIVALTLMVLLNRLSIMKAFVTLNKKNLAYSTVLVNFYLPGVDLSEANLFKADLTQADLTEANLSGANLQEATLVKTYMPRAHFQYAETNLFKADLTQANLTEANLSGANLREATLVKTYMPRVHFQNANLSQANLSQADLTEGDLSRANLKGTRFVKTYMPQTSLQDADLSGADFQGAYGLNTQQVKRAKNWHKAKYDEDFRKQLGLTGSKEAKK